MDSEKIKSLLDIVHAVARLTVDWAEYRSKDPSTKVGACIYDELNGGMFFGYNGFSKNIIDHEYLWTNRDPADGITKYDLVIHAENNAVYKALRAGIDTSKTFLVCTHIPCPRCMATVIAPNNIPSVFYIHPTFNSFTERDRMVVEYIAREANIYLERIYL